ncbi:hypothetical protein Tco_0461301, partial [Tanacetum coccineum]
VWIDFGDGEQWWGFEFGRKQRYKRDRGDVLDYFRMDDPSLTMKEYIMFEEEKAHKRGKVFNWQTATYEKIRVDDDLYDLSSLEAEFPTIVINDASAPEDTFNANLRKVLLLTMNSTLEYHLTNPTMRIIQ